MCPDFTEQLRRPGEARRRSVTNTSIRTAGYVDAANVRESRHRPRVEEHGE